MVPTAADVDALNAHLAKHPMPACRVCGQHKHKFTRIAGLPDVGGPSMAGDGLRYEQTPVAVVTCMVCYSVSLFAWLPIKDAAAATKAPTDT